MRNKRSSQLNVVDSAAIAGVIDLLRTQGSFALSLRFALCLTLQNSQIEEDPAVSYPTMSEYEEITKPFENTLTELLSCPRADGDGTMGLDDISSSPEERAALSLRVAKKLREQLEVLEVKTASPLGDTTRRKRGPHFALSRLSKFVSSDAEDAEFAQFVNNTVDAFFDNDLMFSTQLFLRDAKGSFGLAVCSSLDAHRQVCFAARGQTLSVAFYPRKGLICYGSEQAAVKAGLNFSNPGGNLVNGESFEEDNAVRLDLDDLGGEICLLDWGYAGDADPSISPPNRHLTVDRLMNVNVALLHQSQPYKPLQKRLILLENNEFVSPLGEDCEDPVLQDIRDIPRICHNLQADWKEVGLNRCTAWNLANCISARMKAIVDGKTARHGSSVDILVTGCEVSLWVAEQFVSDLSKSFPQVSTFVGSCLLCYVPDIDTYL